MAIPSEWTHCASVVVDADRKRAFDFMSSGAKQTHWALGSWNRRLVRDDIYVGASLFDNLDLYVRVVGREELLLVDYYGGKTPDQLTWMVSARIIPGSVLGFDDSKSLITLTIWRLPDMSDDDWNLTYHSWHTEMHLIKGALGREAMGKLGATP